MGDSSQNHDSDLKYEPITQKKVKLSEQTETSELNINMDSKTLLEVCKEQALNGVPKCSILTVKDISPYTQPPVPPKMHLTKEQLSPLTPSTTVRTAQDAFSPQLQEWCLKNPITVVQGLHRALKIDLSLFSTKILFEANPDHEIEIRTQVQQSSDENWDTEIGGHGWGCLSYRTYSTVAKYAKYQANCLSDTRKTEKDDESTNNLSDTETKLNPEDTNEKVKKKVLSLSNIKKNLKAPPNANLIKFGTNLDLSDKKKWSAQLKEIDKLPPFFKLVSPGNMLTHIGYDILGMNTVQLYMKVPGSRTPGHQENNSFCAVNINIGPEDTEWFGVSNAYWGVVHKLCERNNLKYLHGSWWPKLEDLHKENVPVYRFLQKPGDLVWVNAGCVHWVQASGFCNNIAWNVGPLTSRQYQLSIERYEWNKIQHYQSVVPMIDLSWKLARNLLISDPKLFEMIKTCLLKTLRHSIHVKEFVKSKGVEIIFNGKILSEPANYCGTCEVEVFNILFIKEREKKPIVYCIDCILLIAPNWQGIVCLEEYEMNELCNIYDKFILHRNPSMSQYQSSSSV